MSPPIIITLTLILCFFLTWHGIFVTNLSQLLARKEIDNKFLGLPTYEYFKDLQYNMPTSVCRLNVWDNYIKFCTYSYYPYCSHMEPPLDLYWIDPYHYFVPLKIEVC